MFGVLKLIWYTNWEGGSSETKELKFKKNGCVFVIYSKKHPIWTKLSAFLSTWHTVVGNSVEYWYRERSDFRGSTGTSRPTYDFGESTPGGWHIMAASARMQISGHILYTVACIRMPINNMLATVNIHKAVFVTRLPF